ncbi:MAG: N-acetylmuramoyl-L-alanine amidase, partial [Pseudomonadota bacterium]
HTDLNSHSIGIEIVNGGHDVPLPSGDLPPFADAQMASVVSLATDILSRHAIPQSRIVGHSDIAPARKRDPGEAFPWEMLAEAGIGLWPSVPDHDLLRGVGLSRGDTGDAVTRLQEALQSIGYAIEPTGTYDADTDLVVMAFQRRWVQERLTGDADWMTIAKIVAVAEAVTAETL